MDTQDRFMNELFRIVSGALRLDVGKVRNYTTFLAEKLDKAGDKNAAGRLRKLLEETDHELRPARIAGARSLPVDEESRFPLVERLGARARTETPVVLSEAQWTTVNEFLSVAKSYAQLEVHGIETSLSLLLYGPPGCGKSRLARYIAAELGLELYVARLDGLISSYLGSTAKNIRALFDFAASTPCVLFLDEFDAIAKLRGDNNELGELKRVVNSFIQNLDSAPKHSVVLAATNHEDLLDSAIWRRFSYRLEFKRPDSGLREALFGNFLPPLVLADKEVDLLVDLTEGFSGSDIQEVCLRLQRLSIATGREPELSDAFATLQNMTLGEGADRRFLSSLQGLSGTEMSTALRKRDRRLYSHALVAQLLGVSKATAFRLAKKGAGDG
jgi:hypothetical protein